MVNGYWVRVWMLEFFAKPNVLKLRIWNLELGSWNLPAP
jgi:hypothetical protein